MENTKGIIKYILSRRDGQQFLAGCLFLIVFQWSFITWLLFKVDRLNEENKEIVVKSQRDLINYITKQNADYFEIKKQVDSAKARLEIFKIEKEMK